MNISEKRDSISDKISTQNFSIFHFRQTSFYATFFNQKFTSIKMNISEKRDSISDKISAQNFLFSVFDKQVFMLRFSAILLPSFFVRNWRITFCSYKKLRTSVTNDSKYKQNFVSAKRILINPKPSNFL